MRQILLTLTLTVFSTFAHAAEYYSYSPDSKARFQTWSMPESGWNQNTQRYQHTIVEVLEGKEWRQLPHFKTNYGYKPSWAQEREGVNLNRSLVIGRYHFQVSAETCDGIFKIYRETSKNERRYIWNFYICNTENSCALSRTFDDILYEKVRFFYNQNDDLNLSFKTENASEQIHLIDADEVKRLKPKDDGIKPIECQKYDPFQDYGPSYFF